MNSSSAAVVNCDNQNNEKLAMRNLEITKYYKIKSKCETNGGVIAKTANKALIIIRKVTKKIEKISIIQIMVILIVVILARMMILIHINKDTSEYWY